MWWHDLFWGLWNGFTGWFVLFAHIIGWWESQPVYDPSRAGNWYDLGFLIGAGSPFFGGLRANRSRREKD